MQDGQAANLSPNPWADAKKKNVVEPVADLIFTTQMNNFFSQQEEETLVRYETVFATTSRPVFADDVMFSLASRRANTVQ